MDWIKSIGSNPVEVAAATIALIALYFAWPAFRARDYARRRERVLDTRLWNNMINALQPDWAQRYYGAIAGRLDWFDRFYGPRLLGWRAFDRAVQVAFVYAISTLLIGWVLFDAGNLGGAAFLPAGQTFWQRGAGLLAMAAVGGIVFAVLRFDPPIKAMIVRWVSARAQTRPALLLRLHPETWAEIGHYVLLILAGAFAFAVGVAFAGAGAGAGALAVAVAVAGAVAGALAGALAVAGAFARTESFPYFTIDFNGISEDRLALLAIYILFLIILPILNAVADYLSIAATRQFLRRIHTRKPAVWGVLLGLALDIIIAIACLALLLVLITQTLDLWAAYIPIPLTFDWRAYRETLCAGNWQQGTMLWLMLATTLAPTALHLAVGVGAMAAHRAHIDLTIRDIMTQTRDRFVDLYGVAALEMLDRTKAENAFPTVDHLHQVEQALAKKEGSALALSFILFAVFMAGLFAFVIWLGHTFAMPQLCPTP